MRHERVALLEQSNRLNLNPDVPARRDAKVRRRALGKLGDDRCLAAPYLDKH